MGKNTTNDVFRNRHMDEIQNTTKVKIRRKNNLLEKSIKNMDKPARLFRKQRKHFDRRNLSVCKAKGPKEES